MTDLLWTLTNEELEKQYIILCKKLHPDRNNEDTTKEFQELTSLYEKIKTYRKEPLNITLSVSLSEIYHGCIKDITVPCPETKTPRTLPIFVPMGIMDGTVITSTTEQGGQINVTIKEVNDTKFVRDGYNLIVYLDITLTQALIGDHVAMGHFNRTMSIPTQIPHTNYRHIIPGMGMPIASSQAGDLYVVYNILLPKEISTDFAHNLLELSY